MRDTAIGKGQIAFVLWALVGHAATTGAQVVTPSTTTSSNTAPSRVASAHIIEWDLPEPIDFNPGAVAVDTRGEDSNRAWFVTRLADTPGGRKVYRFDFEPSLMKNKGNARWTSWELAPDVINNGGVAKLRPSHDRRFVVARTSSSIQEIDTQACVAGSVLYPSTCASALRRWDFADPESPDPDSVFVSDVAVDDARRIFTVGRSQAFPTGYLQLLVPTRVAYTSSKTPIAAPAGTVTRWRVDGVDQCQSFGISGFCNSGVDFLPSSGNQNLVYFSDQGFATSPTAPVVGAIGELNISSSQVRRWPMPRDSTSQQVAEPRQMKIDSKGIIWTVTGSGHLVSLDPRSSKGCPAGTNRMTRSRMPPEFLQNDGWGIAPDSDVVGYTDANNNKVGMLLPHDGGVCVPPVSETVNKLDIPATVTTMPTVIVSDVTPGAAKTVLKKTTAKNDGTFVEAVINAPAPAADPTLPPPDSLSPLGITPVKSKGQGTFFYAVGMTAGADTSGPVAGPSFAKRVGFVRLGVPERIKNPRDDDDADDGMDTTTHPTWHTSEVGDNDADGVPDTYDTATARENMTLYAAAPAASLTATDYSATASATALALVATAQADDLTATIAVDIYSALGALVASSGAAPGLAAVTVPSPGAGTFTVRVRNLSGRTVNVSPFVLVREPPM
jgi:hypothetical protein